MFSLLIFGSVLALTVAQQCPVIPDSGSIQYPPLSSKNISIGETPPKGAGLEGWLLVPRSLIDAVWGDNGFPYAVFDQSQPNAVAQFPSGHVPVIATAVLGFTLSVVLLSCCCCVCFFWCCCCCFEDNDDSFKDNSDNFACKLLCFIAVLVVVVMMLLLTLVGAVFGLVANVGMSDAIGSFPPTANEAATAMRDFLDGLNADVTTVIEGGFNFTVDCLQNRTIGLDGTFSAALAENSNFTSLLDAASMSVSVSTAELTAIETFLGIVNSSVEDVNTLTAAISSALNNTMISGVPDGSEVQTAVDNLVMVTSSSAPLQAILSTNLSLGSIQPELEQLDAGLTETFSNNVEGSLQTVMSDLASTLRDDIGGAVEQFSSGIVLVNSLLDTLVNGTDLLQTEPLDPTQPLLTYNTVRDLWYWLAVIFCVLVLLSIFLISLGLVVGGIPYSCQCVPKRKRVSNIGSRLLMVSLGTSMLTGALLLPMAAICFYAGASGQELCEPLTSDESFAATLDNDEWRRGELRVILESALTFNGSSEVVTLLTQATSGIGFANGLRACQENQSLWSAFQLEKLLARYAALSTGLSFSSFNLTSLLTMFSNAIDPTNVTADTMSALEAVSNNISAFDGVSFPVVVLEDITSYVNQSREAVLSAEMALTSLETALGANSSIQATVAPVLRNVQDALEQLMNINSSLNAIEASRLSVETQTTALNSSLAQLSSELLAVEGDLIDNNSSLYQAVTSDVQSIIDGVLDYYNHTRNSLSRDVGRCFPLWAGYNNLRNNICLDLISYLNAYWYSLGWCFLWLVLLFIPVIILAMWFRQPLEKPLSMKDRAKNASRSIELLNVSGRENGWAWRQPSNEKIPVEMSQPGTQPLSFDDLPFERTTSYSKSTFSSQGATGPAFERAASLSAQSTTEATIERARASSSMQNRPLPNLPPEQRDPKLVARPLPDLPPEQGNPNPAARPHSTAKKQSHPPVDINAAAAAAEPHGLIPEEPEEYLDPTECEPYEQTSAAEAKQQTSQCESEEHAPLLQKKTSERMKNARSVEEKVEKDERRSPVDYLYVNECASSGSIKKKDPQAHEGVEEEDDYVIANPQQCQVATEEMDKTTLESASSLEQDVEGATISFDEVDSD